MKTNLCDIGRINQSVEDWFDTYLGYLQCVSRCTSVWFMLGHVDVIIGYTTSFRLATVCMCSALVTKASHHHAEVENSRVLPRETLLS